MKKTNFDRYLEDQLHDPAFAARFSQAGEAWDVALQLVALREQAEISQGQLARILKTSQQQISRLESPAYEGHSLSMLRRVASALHARVRVVFEPLPEPGEGSVVREEAATEKATRRKNVPQGMTSWGQGGKRPVLTFGTPLGGSSESPLPAPAGVSVESEN